MNEKLTIEETFALLEEILTQMEKRDISLEESFACYVCFRSVLFL